LEIPHGQAKLMPARNECFQARVIGKNRNSQALREG